MKNNSNNKMRRFIIKFTLTELIQQMNSKKLIKLSKRSHKVSDKT